MANTISKPTSDVYIVEEENPGWLNTPSPFDKLDDQWYEIIVFYVFHVPVAGMSARAKSLESYGWGSKSKNDDFKQLKKRLMKYGQMAANRFRCEDGWAQLKQAIKDNNLFDFPTELTCERVSYRKAKSGENDSLLSHIRNSFAHGRLAFYSENGDIYVAMEDIDDKNHVSARMILSKQTLLRWKIVIEAGPLITEEDLERKFDQKES